MGRGGDGWRQGGGFVSSKKVCRVEEKVRLASARGVLVGFVAPLVGLFGWGSIARGPLSVALGFGGVARMKRQKRVRWDVAKCCMGRMRQRKTIGALETTLQ